MNVSSTRKRIIITGIAGRLGRLLARRLHRQGDCQVIGIDRRAFSGRPKDIEHVRVDLRSKKARDVFRSGTIEARLGDRDLVVVPHATLHHVPFHALSRRGVPILVEREVTVAPSSTVLVCASARRRATGRPIVVSVPDASAPAIAAEARVVARTLDAQLLTGRHATADGLRAATGRARSSRR